LIIVPLLKKALKSTHNAQRINQITNEDTDIIEENKGSEDVSDEGNN